MNRINFLRDFGLNRLTKTKIKEIMMRFLKLVVSTVILTFLALATGILAGCGDSSSSFDAVCEDGQCSQVCSSGDSCNADCTGGLCNQTCGADGSCTFNCSGGQCIQKCAASATCVLNCGGDGQCSQNCNGSENCTTTCPADNCS